MTANSPERPIPPDPLSFGLTKDRVARLSAPGIQDWFVEGPVLWSGALTALGSYVFTQSGSAAIFGLLAGTAGLFMALGLVEVIWPRTQPDFASFQKYRAAETAYNAQRAAWERTQLDWWSSLGPRSFERELAALLRDRGQKVNWTGRAGDGGVDIRIEHTDGTETIVQCKAHAKPVGPAAVRDLYGAMTHRGAREAWVVSIEGYTQAARDFTVGKAIRLRTIAEVLRDE